MKAQSVKNLIILLGMVIAVLLLITCFSDQLMLSRQWQKRSKKSMHSAIHHSDRAADYAEELMEVTC